MIREDHGELVDACQDGRRSSEFVHAVTTRAQKRHLPDSVPTPSDVGEVSDVDFNIDFGPGRPPPVLSK